MNLKTQNNFVYSNNLSRSEMKNVEKQQDNLLKTKYQDVYELFRFVYIRHSYHAIYDK